MAFLRTLLEVFMRLLFLFIVFLYGVDFVEGSLLSSKFLSSILVVFGNVGMLVS